LPPNLRPTLVTGIRELNASDGQPADEVYLRALNLLARRDHSVAELKKKLVARGFSAGLVAETLERLTGEGYLDDRRFAERWAESALRNGKGFGVRLLLELQRRGVARDVAAEAVSGAAAEQGEQQLLAGIAAKRFAAFDPAAATLNERRRVYAYLQRRGFSLAAINEYFRSRDD